VCELREARYSLFAPAFGAELRRLVVPARVALDGPLEGEDLHAGGDVVAADLAVAHGLAPDGVGRWVESHRFFDDPLRVTQPRQVRDGRRAPAQNFGEFRRESLLGFGVAREQNPRP